jgi:hypothetical protein
MRRVGLLGSFCPVGSHGDGYIDMLGRLNAAFYLVELVTLLQSITASLVSDLRLSLVSISLFTFLNPIVWLAVRSSRPISHQVLIARHHAPRDMAAHARAPRTVRTVHTRDNHTAACGRTPATTCTQWATRCAAGVRCLPSAVSVYAVCALLSSGDVM